MRDNRSSWRDSMRRVAALIAAFFLCVSPLLRAADSAQQQRYDLIIEHGRVVDGTGAPWFAADIGIRSGRIAAIGRLDKANAKRRIDAAGRIVAPGFIDMLGQSELTMLVNPHVPSKIFQGITTEITGEGDTVAPQTDATLEDFRPEFEHYSIKPDWRTFTQYFARLRSQGMGI